MHLFYQHILANPNTLDAICFRFCQFAYTSNFLSEILSSSSIKSASTAKDSLNGTAFAVLVHLGLVVKVDQLDVIERRNIESHRFKTIRRIMGAMKSLYLYNNFVVRDYRDKSTTPQILGPAMIKNRRLWPQQLSSAVVSSCILDYGDLTR